MPTSKTGVLTGLPEPISGLEQTREPGLDVNVPHRAGAIVAEFISSIVGEAQARADQIVLAASEDARSRREAALEAVARVREAQAALLNELEGLRGDLRREAEWLHADPRISGRVQEPVDAAFASTLAVREDRAGADAKDATTGDPQSDADAEGAEVVHGEEDDSTGRELIKRPDSTSVAEAQGSVGRFERMADDELARAYTNAVRAAARDAHGHRADSMRRLADAALQEALRRPAFTGERAPARRRPLSRSNRRRNAALDELRNACMRALAS